MKSEKLDPAWDILVARDHWDVPIRVSMLAYVRFSRRLDRQLAGLVAQWARMAAPNASGLPRRRK